MGGDRGPDEVVAGALEAASDLGRADSLRAAGPRYEGPRARRGLRGDRDAREAGRGRSSQGRQLARPRVPRGRTRRGGRGRLRRKHRCDSGGGALLHPPSPRGRPARDRGRDPGARRPLGAARLGGERGREAGAPAPVRPDGRDLLPRDARGRTPGSPAAVDRRRAREGKPAHARGARAARRRATSTSAGTSRAVTCSATPATSSSATASPATSASRLLEGTIKTVLEGHPRRDPLLDSREARRAADPAGGTPSPRAPRPRHVRRRLPAGAQRAGRDRARKLVAEGDRERDPPRRARRRAQARRPAGGAPARRPC